MRTLQGKIQLNDVPKNFENIKQIQSREGGHLRAEIRWKCNKFFQKFANCFESIFCLINKIYWAWDITVSSYVVWGIKLNSNKDYLSREKCQKQDTL